jgi:flagellin-like protein
MKKRGISPLIATVLLIGVAVVLTVVLANFFRDISNDQTDDIDFNTKLGQYCQATDLTFVNSCWSGDAVSVTQDLFLILENEGSYPIRDINFVFVNSVTGERTVTTLPAPTDPLLAYTRKRYTFFGIPSGNNIDEITYTKIVDVDGVLGNCNPIKIELESYLECSP